MLSVKRKDLRNIKSWQMNRCRSVHQPALILPGLNLLPIELGMLAHRHLRGLLILQKLIDQTTTLHRNVVCWPQCNWLIEPNRSDQARVMVKPVEEATE